MIRSTDRVLRPILSSDLRTMCRKRKTDYKQLEGKEIEVDEILPARRAHPSWKVSLGVQEKVLAQTPQKLQIIEAAIPST